MKRISLLTVSALTAVMMVWGGSAAEAQRIMGRGPGQGVGAGQGVGMVGGQGAMGMMGMFMQQKYSPRWVLALKDEIGLTDEQEEAIEEIEDGHLDTVDDIVDKIEDAYDDLEDIIEEDDVDVSAAEAKIREIEKLRGDLHVEQLTVSVAVKKLLTAEQIEELDDIREERGAGRGVGRGMSGRGGMHNQRR